MTGLEFLRKQFGIDESRLRHLLGYVFRFIYARMEDGASLEQIEKDLLGKDAEGPKHN